MGEAQGTVGMFDSLPFKMTRPFRYSRLIVLSPPERSELVWRPVDKGVARHDDGVGRLARSPYVRIPGGVTLTASDGEDAGKSQTIGARFATNQSRSHRRRRSASGMRLPGRWCSISETAATSQVVAESLGLAVPHSALAPSGQPIWLEAARRSARAVFRLKELGLTTRHIVTQASIRNAMAVHSAFGGSTNLLLHLPAVAHAAGLEQPSIDDWMGSTGKCRDWRWRCLMSILPYECVSPGGVPG